MQSRTLSLILTAFLVCLSTSQLTAQTARSITVVGVAQAELAPDHYLLPILLKSEGKTMELARAEYRKRLENLKTVFNEMDFPELTLVSTGQAISDAEPIDPNQMQMMFIEGQGEAEPKEGFFIRERVDIRWNVSPQLTPAELESGLANLLDRIKAEKLSFAVQQNVNYYPAPEVSLVSGRHSQLQTELRSLRAAAMRDAQNQARELAEMAGGKLGRVLEVEIPDETSAHDFAHSDDTGLLTPNSSSRFGNKLQLKVNLRVRFELE